LLENRLALTLPSRDRKDSVHINVIPHPSPLPKKGEKTASLNTFTFGESLGTFKNVSRLLGERVGEGELFL
jgi:hypothetical protein